MELFLTWGVSFIYAGRNIGGGHMAGAYKPIAVFLLIVAVSCAALVFFSPRKEIGPRIRTGEEMIYGLYAGDHKIGTIAFWIEGTETLEGARCHVARYSLSTPDTAKSGKLKFDETGRLRHVKIAFVENQSPRWVTEIGYSYLLNVARVIVEDNRNSENYRELDNLLRLPGETFVSEHLWYLLRLEDLHLGYERGFYVHSLPEATQLGAASAEVIGEERVSTPAGNFDCWIVKGTNVTDRLWIAKGGAAVVKAMENVDGVEITYMLEAYA